MVKYPKTFKERVVTEYSPRVRGKGFQALSKRFKIPKMVIKKWWRQWNAGGQSIDAFEDQERGHRKSILTEREKRDTS